MNWSEKLAVAEKLALIEAPAEFEAGGSGVAVDSAGGGVPEPGSDESGTGWAVSASAAGSVLAMSRGTESSLEATDIVLASAGRSAPWPRAGSMASRATASTVFARTGGLESARTTSVIPIIVVTSAATAPARHICRRLRSVDGAVAGRPHHIGMRVGTAGSVFAGTVFFSVSSTVCNPVLLSSS